MLSHRICHEIVSVPHLLDNPKDSNVESFTDTSIGKFIFSGPFLEICSKLKATIGVGSLLTRHMPNVGDY